MTNEPKIPGPDDEPPTRPEADPNVDEAEPPIAPGDPADGTPVDKPTGPVEVEK